MSFYCPNCREHIKLSKMPQGVTSVACPTCRHERRRLIGPDGNDLGEFTGNASYYAVRWAEEEKKEDAA